MSNLSITLDKKNVATLKKLASLADITNIVIQDNELFFITSAVEQFKIYHTEVDSEDRLESTIPSPLLKSILQPGILEIEWNTANIVLKLYSEGRPKPKIAVVVKNKMIIAGDFRKNLNILRAVLIEDAESSFEGLPLTTIAMVCKACDGGVIVKNGTAFTGTNPYFVFMRDCALPSIDLTLTKEGIVALSEVNKIKNAKYFVKDNYITYREDNFFLAVKKARAEIPFDLNILRDRAIFGKVEISSLDFLKSIESMPPNSASSTSNFVINGNSGYIGVGSDGYGIISITTEMNYQIFIERFEIKTAGLLKLKSIFTNNKEKSIMITVYLNFVVVDVGNISLILHRGDV